MKFMSFIFVILMIFFVEGIMSLNQAKEKKAVNHLADEKSPYLIQHAENPVDWYPWGEEAFEKA